MFPADPVSVEPLIRKMIRTHAWRVSGRRGFRVNDVEDLEQSLTLQLLKAWTAYDPERDWHGYAATVLKHAAAKLIREQGALKRSKHRTESLCCERADAQANRVAEAKQQAEAQSCELAIDLDALFATLPEQDAAILRLLLTKTITETAATIGKPRSTIYAVLRRVRRQCEKADLCDYL